MVLGAAADSASAGYGTASTSGTVYGRSSYGSYSGSYQGTTTYYDPTAAQIASQRNAQMVENYAASGRSWLQMLEDNLFYSVDLNPGQEYFGIIFSKKGTGVYYRVRSKNDSIRLLSIEYLKVQN